MNELFENATAIHSYSRRQMINDGYLIEVPGELARQAGFKVPIGILLEPWELCVAWSDEERNIFSFSILLCYESYRQFTRVAGLNPPDKCWANSFFRIIMNGKY